MAMREIGRQKYSDPSNAAYIATSVCEVENRLPRRYSLVMPATISIPDELFERIQKQAIPFVDLDPASVIIRWADFFDASSAPPETVRLGAQKIELPVAEGKRFNPMNPPELFHTRVAGQIGGRRFDKWNDLVRLAHVLAFGKAVSLEELRNNTRANVLPGNLSGKVGYKFVPEINASIQGLDANKAWECALRLAKYAELPLSARFYWRDNPKAAFPGEKGVLEWLPEVSP